MRGFALAIATLAGCAFTPDYDGTTYTCDANGACPDGYACVEQRCLPSEPPPATCATAIGTGDAHACAIRSDGTAWCWGNNSAGQLGDGSTDARTEPVHATAVGLPELTAIAGGGEHTCAVGVDHTVWCWGRNRSGQLGDGSTSDNHAPVQVTGITSASAIVAGDSHTCALLDGGSVKCWGANDSGQLGNGSMGGASPTPVAAQLSPGVTALAAGNSTTCAVDAGAAVQCWGANEVGQLGNDMTSRGPTPAPGAMKLPASNAIGIAVGDQFACAVTSAGEVYCTGTNQDGELGTQFADTSSVPLKIPLDTKAVAVVAGDRFACAIDDQKQLWCWGANDNAQLADRTMENRVIPVRAAYPDALEVTTGGSGFVCVRSSDGLRCGGYNGLGQLGDGHRTTTSTPQPVTGLTEVTAMALGNSYTCATRMDQTATCWGENDLGQLGDGTWAARTRPVPVVSLTGIQKLATGERHACALLMDSTMVCWGENSHGQLGDGTFERRGVPRPVAAGSDANGRPLAASLTGVKDIAVGEAHTCALLEDGSLKCWGFNQNGQIGDPDLSDKTTPVKVQTGTLAPTGVLSIVAGGAHSCAIDGSHKVWCWGANAFGQLGTGQLKEGGNDVDRTSQPTRTLDLDTVAIDQLTAFGGFTCAHSMDNRVWCWGYDNDGEIGTGDFTFAYFTPQNIAGLTATKVVAGDFHTCALTTDGSVTCWGGNYTGQVGIDVYNSYPTRTMVPGLSGVVDLAAGANHTCARLADATITCWGDDRDGELGHGLAAKQLPVAPLLVCP